MATASVFADGRLGDGVLATALAERIEQGTFEIPMLSGVIGEVVSLCSNPDCEARDLAELIKRDQLLLGKLLGVANSALMAPVTQITSVQQAVGRLGFSRIRQIALLVACKSRVFAVQGHELRVQALFAHSLAAGAFAQEVARSVRSNVEESFVAGMLHDVGKPVILQFAVDHSSEFGRDVRAAEIERVMDLAHEEIGSRVVRAWGLPQSIIDVIRTHHSPEACEGREVLARIVAFADDLAKWALDAPGVSESGVRRHPSVDALDIYPDAMERILSTREQVLEFVEVSQ